MSAIAPVDQLLSVWHSGAEAKIPIFDVVKWFEGQRLLLMIMYAVSYLLIEITVRTPGFSL